jgi:cytochrome c biogenesis protein CcdA
MLFLIAFFAGILTVLAPCVLPLLPVIIGGSLGGKSKMRPVVVTLSLAFSVVLFTLLLRVATALISVPLWFWSGMSGSLVFVLGLSFLFPSLWSALADRCGLDGGSKKMMYLGKDKSELVNACVIGVSLGPVFASCSPTYALIVAISLPASFVLGLGYMVAYALGLSFVMFLVAYFGQRIVLRLKWLANPNGGFKKVLGVVFVLVGLSIAFGIDKKVESFAIEKGWYGAVELEESLIKRFDLF